MTTFDPNHPRFAHDQLDAYTVARDALVRGDVLARQLPRGFANQPTCASYTVTATNP